MTIGGLNSLFQLPFLLVVPRIELNIPFLGESWGCCLFSFSKCSVIYSFPSLEHEFPPGDTIDFYRTDTELAPNQ
ncbi:hypothetical protein K2173_003750 [Erythroxylum novogranatense]|uniref:Uncharacterized protein n=1 Tax=Erythroxylum novogranatense TaxID=1862640 RepID=A0AAV8TCY9_9ROSI|nr:hypothetical protein K2173_003750 [Erythroxylum novogranatense]